MTDIQITPAATPPTNGTAEKFRKLSEGLESTFLAEMLKHAKFAEPPESFGGGIGEDQFASFLRQAVADKISATGGIGLAETIFSSLISSTRGDAHD